MNTTDTAAATATDTGPTSGPDVERARYDRGAQVLAAVDGAGRQRVVDAPADVAPAAPTAGRD